MNHEPSVAGLCAAWGHGPPEAIEPLGTGGFSGAAVHLVRLAGLPRPHVLKPFAAGVGADRAAWVHGLMRHARAHGVLTVPDVLAAHDGRSAIPASDGRLWELVEFVVGQPHDPPTPAQAIAAAETLARLHAAVASLPGAAPCQGPSPGGRRRIEQARDMLARPWLARLGSIARDTAAAPPESLAAVLLSRARTAAELLAAPRGIRGLTALAMRPTPIVRLQAVVRDVWSGHVLFDRSQPERVAGIIDFHAAGIDTSATDLARLLGSWQGSEPVRVAAHWNEAVEAYGRVMPLAAHERPLIDWLHASGVVCGLDNWFRWVLEENRQFPDGQQVLDRVDGLMRRLPPALEWLADTAAVRV